MLEGKLLLLVIGFAACASHCYYLPIQAHSFNDLNYLSNLIDKGITYFKLDVSMSNRESCLKHSTWNRQDKCYNSSQYVQQICCLALRGDASSSPSYSYDFNISAELITMLDVKLTDITREKSTKKLLFAINFQYDHNFNDPMTEGFLLQLAGLLSKFPHNLLIGTGSDSFILEYDRICYGVTPIHSAPQEVETCTVARKAIANSPIFLQSGSQSPYDPRNHAKRYKNFNVFYKQIESYCLKGFPQWITQYPQFPLIFWQPSNQRQIQYVLDHFLSPACMKRHGRNLTGMAMATNIDSQMFEIYMKKYYHVSWDTLAAASNVSWSAQTHKLLFEEQKYLKLSSLNSTLYTCSIQFYTQKLVISSYELNSSTKTFNRTAVRALPFFEKQKITALLNDGEQYLIMITKANSTNSKVYYFDIKSNFQQVSSQQFQLISAATMRGKELLYVRNQQNKMVIEGSVEFKSVKQYASFDATMFISTLSSIEYVSEENYFVIAGESAESSKNGLSVLMIIEDGTLLAPPRILTYGSSPKIVKKKGTSELFIMVQNSMCHSALLINNNEMNKCNFFREADFSSLTNVKGLTNIIEGKAKDLANNYEPISPCHSKIKLTKALNTLNSDFCELEDVLVIGGEYLKIEEEDLVGSLFCGGSGYEKQYRGVVGGNVITTVLKTAPGNAVGTRKQIRATEI